MNKAKPFENFKFRKKEKEIENCDLVVNLKTLKNNNTYVTI